MSPILGVSVPWGEEKISIPSLVLSSLSIKRYCVTYDPNTNLRYYYLGGTIVNRTILLVKITKYI